MFMTVRWRWGCGEAPAALCVCVLCSHRSERSAVPFPVTAYLSQLGVSIDRAIDVSLGGGARQQHVHSVVVVRGRAFYGMQQDDEQLFERHEAYASLAAGGIGSAPAGGSGSGAGTPNSRDATRSKRARAASASSAKPRKSALLMTQR